MLATGERELNIPPMEDTVFRLHKMELKLHGEKHYLDYTKSTHATFTSKVMSTILEKKFKQPTVGTYNGPNNYPDRLVLRDWLNLYHKLMSTVGVFQ